MGFMFALSSYDGPGAQTGGTNVLAIVSLISGILSFVGSGCCCVPIISLLAMFGVPLLALVAIVTGILGISAASRTGTGKGMAITGIGLGVMGILTGIGLIVASMFLGIGVSALDAASRGF